MSRHLEKNHTEQCLSILREEKCGAFAAVFFKKDGEGAVYQGCQGCRETISKVNGRSKRAFEKYLRSFGGMMY